MCAGPKAMFTAVTAIAVQRFALAKYGKFIAGLTSADEKLKRDVETTEEAQKKTVQPRTKPALLLMMKLHCPAPYFANALLAAVDVLYFSKYLTLRLRIRTSKLIIDKRILFNVRWQGRRFDFKICVQAKNVTKRKAPKQKTFRIKDCCRTKNS